MIMYQDPMEDTPGNQDVRKTNVTLDNKTSHKGQLF